MAKLALLAGTTSKRLYVFIQDSSQTDGRGLTGLVFNSANLVASYVLPGAARVAITLATQTVTGAYSSGGFVEVDSTNMPGVYRFDPPNAALAVGNASVLIMLKGAANMAPCLMEVELTAIDNQAATNGGMSVLTTIQADTDDIQTRLPAALVSGRIDASVGAMAANVLTATAINADAFTAAKFAADVTTELQAGLATAAALATAQTAITAIQGFVDTEVASILAAVDTEVATLVTGVADIQSRLPTALSSGRIIARTEVIATDAVDAAALKADAVTEIQTGLATAAALVTAQNDLTTLVGRLTAIRAGLLDNLASLDATVSSRASAASLATVAGFVDTEVAAILAAVDTEVGSILTAATDIQARLPAALVSGRIDASVGAMAADVITSSALSAGAVDEILDDTIGDGTITVRQALRVLIAGMAGKLSGAATTTVTIRNLADSANVVVATVDSDGNRSAVTVTP